ncbi:anti-sigma factor [Patescibacteria group bacterium]|nr:anti-sigma factor [Patescibacteria group bacterium]MBU0777390.1 anti-sigma factor [Patescibacteria group bacterium]MBU0846026.1 anti-sigma factor [Patescibacteria group bacterium]MBU0922474.1 anti-sigma factor [Patescibacteria group bacterium]MBU1066793.1 anti-sigma factor [Patescibacteria group bacterium]
MKRKDIVIGLIVLAALAGIIYWFQKPKEELKVPETPSVEEKMEGIFSVEIPEDIEKAQLKDAVGGDASGIATRSYDNGTFIHVVLADLPGPEEGFFYEGWLVRGKEGDADFDFISTGIMRLAKGGYLLEFESEIDYLDYQGVVITLEETEDDIPEKHVLEGAF